VFWRLYSNTLYVVALRSQFAQCGNIVRVNSAVVAVIFIVESVVGIAAGIDNYPAINQGSQ